MTAKYTNLAYNDSQVYNLQRYLVDEVSDIQDLPTNCGPGSKAIVAATGDSYLLNNKHEWKKQLVSTGGNSGGGTSEEDIEQIVENILETKDYATENYVDTKVPDVSGFYTKPQSGIPAADLESGVVPDLSAYAKKNNPVLTGNLSLGTSVTSDGGFGAVGTGLYVKATGRSAHAEGQSSVASGWTAHAEGLQTKASGDYSHAEGYGSSMGNVAVGNVTYIVGASGSAGHSEGENTIAAGNASHAEGQGTVAIGAYTHVGGTYNVIDSDFSNFTEWVSGTSYNVGDVVKVTTANSIKVYSCLTANSDETFTDSKWNQNYIKMQYAEIIGNGVDNSHRSNARSLDWNGNEVLAGGLTVNSNSGITIGNTTLTEQALGTLMQPLIIEVNQNGVLSETWDDIADAFALGRRCIIVDENNGNTMITNVLSVMNFNNIYSVSTLLMGNTVNFTTSSSSGYPSASGNAEEEDSEPHFQLTYDQTINTWRWTTNDPNFNIADFTSANSGDDNIAVYATINNNSEILMTILWTDDSADSDVLVITGNDSNATYKFALYTDNTANLLETGLIPEPK